MKRSITVKKILLLTVLCVCVAFPALAGNWPERPVKMLTMVNPGAQIDLLTRSLAEALKEAGLGVDADPTEVAEKLSKAMLKITVDGLTGKLTWNDKGQVQKEPTAYVITDGKYVQA